MLSLAKLTRTVSGTSKRSLPRLVGPVTPRITSNVPFAFAPAARPFPMARMHRVAGTVRHYSVISEECKAKEYDYDQIRSLATQPKPDTIIVDVREPVEFQEGHIPGAINIPFKSNPGALSLSEEEFEETFGVPKPPKDKELVFYCLAGIRSTAAEDLAKTFGYKKRGNYVGSYEDWVKNEIKRT